MKAKTTIQLKEYSVKQLATLADISVRTLHFYDEKGLLSPARVKPNGYRVYGEEQLIKLQQILFFRELDLTIDQIKEMFDSPRFNQEEALRDQKKLIEMKRKRLDGLVKTINNTLKRKSKNMTQQNDANKIDEEMYGSLSKKQIEEYKVEVREKYGSKVVDESAARMKDWTKEDYKRVEAEGIAITQAVADVIDKGVESPEVQAAISKHYDHMNMFYTCSYKMYRGLGSMYVDDPRFTAYYEKFRPGFAVEMRDAIHYFCDVKEKAEK